jgi:exonuclease SbcD
MKILHTSDWHLGHTLHDRDREFEHRSFLDWLIQRICELEIDALLISGDIFDTANPSASSQELWFGFLAQALKAKPGLQIVAIAGNHDSAARLEAPDRLLREFDIRVIGSLPRKTDGTFNAESVSVSLKDKSGKPQAVVIAMPFLRTSDLPSQEGAEDPIVEGVHRLYTEALESCRPMKIPILAMGHCFLVNAHISDLSERKVLGGNQHPLPVSLFPEELVYAALGHLHLPQSMAAGRIRYSGSPIPLAMSERHYPHSVTIIDLQLGGAIHQEQVRIPRTVDFVRIPDTDYLPLEELLEALRKLPDRPTEKEQKNPCPFLEVGVRLDKPEATMRSSIMESLEGKGFFLAKISTQFTGTGQALGDVTQIHGLRDLEVEDVFKRKWSQDFQGEPTSDHLAALHELIDQVKQEASR